MWNNEEARGVIWGASVAVEDFRNQAHEPEGWDVIL